MSNENVKKIPSDTPESVFSEGQGEATQSDLNSLIGYQNSDECVTPIAASESASISALASSVEPLVPASDSSETVSETTSTSTSDTVTEEAITAAETTEKTRNKTGATTTTTARVNFVNIPAILKSSCSFCVWRKEKRNGTV